MHTEGVLVHTFLTTGFVPWGEFFLEALRYQHGERLPVRIDGRDLSNEDIALLNKAYGNLEIYNQDTDFVALADVAGVDQKTIARWRKETEQGILTEENVLFKIFISVNQRYRSMDKVFFDAKQAGYDCLLHCDADVYIRDSLEPTFNIVQEHDVSLFIRKNKPHRLKVLGGFLGFNLKANSDAFIKCWMEEIDKVPFTERWRGFGQSVIWFAVEKCKELRIADFNSLLDAPKFSKKFELDRELWVGNSKVKKRGPDKVVTLPLFWEDLKSRYPRIPLPRRNTRERLKAAWRTFLAE